MSRNSYFLEKKNILSLLEKAKDKILSEDKDKAIEYIDKCILEIKNISQDKLSLYMDELVKNLK